MSKKRGGALSPSAFSSACSNCSAQCYVSTFLCRLLVPTQVVMRMTSSLGWMAGWRTGWESVGFCKYHVSDMTCMNLPCKISIDFSLRTAAHSYILGVPNRRG